MRFTANLPTLAILKKITFFFEKLIYFFFKRTPEFEHFDETYYFSRILRQIFYNLVRKNSRSETWTNIVNAIGKHWVKKRTHLRGRLCSLIITKMAQKNKYSRRFQVLGLWTIARKPYCRSSAGKHYSCYFSTLIFYERIINNSVCEIFLRSFANYSLVYCETLKTNYLVIMLLWTSRMQFWPHQQKIFCSKSEKSNNLEIVFEISFPKCSLQM